eukprot:7386588-Prymnesium_polylepis.5
MRQLTESPGIERRQARLQVFDQVACLIPIKAALGDGEDDDRDPMRHCLVQLEQAPRAREYSESTPFVASNTTQSETCTPLSKSIRKSDKLLESRNTGRCRTLLSRSCKERASLPASAL